MSRDKTTSYPVEPRFRRRAGTRPVIVVVEGRRNGTSLPLGPATVVGKGTGADLDIDDPGVSRKHAKFVVSSDGAVTVMDLASTNGTYVNDTAVEIAAVRAGDRIRFGPKAEVRLWYQAKDGSREDPAAALSPRQREVARLVADGLTSAQIAQRLSIAVRTVTTHIDEIYRRLGLTSRAALARWVVETGLVDH